jgi:hypothetical protein
MGKKTPYSRTTISVPGDLKRRMDAVKEPVNWSALACRAFEDKLAEIATKSEQNGLEAIIKRLRATNPDLLYQQGHEDGRRWASEQARCDDLVRLERFHDRKRAAGEWEKFFDRTVDKELSLGQCLMKCICPELPAGDLGTGNIYFDYDAWCGVCKDFWKSFVGDEDSKVNNPSYVRGFAEGALALWLEVKDRL